MELRRLRAFNKIFLILLLSCIIRILLSILIFTRSNEASIFYAPDSGNYVKLAQTLSETGRFEKQGEPELVRTPGYPLFLVPGVIIGHVEGVTIVLQIL